MAVFCNKCGKDLLEQSRYCPFCGVVSRRTVDGSIAFVEPEQGPYCPACGKRTMKESKHCMWCGLEVHVRPEGAGALRCPQCGEKNPGDAGFCSRCRMDFGKWFVGSVGEARVLAGRYRLDEELGRGGMGVVYRAFDVKLEMDVAVKMVPSELAKNKRAVGQLKKEAKIAIQLTHPNINRLYTFEEEGQEAYLVMEYVDGRTLDEIIEEREVLPERMVRELALQVLAGLSEAHARGVVHRDLKPANIMVNSEGRAKILDFGIARVIKDTMTRLSTQAVSSSGTLLYMAPEQIKGMRETVRTDLYAFGAMMYELLSGEPLFCRGAIEHQIINENPRALEGVSPWLNDVILRCLSKEPERRYASAKELAAVLKAGGSGAPRQAPVAPPPLPKAAAPTPVPSRITKEREARGELPELPAGVPVRRKKWLVWGVSALLVLAGVLGWYLGVVMPRAADEERERKAAEERRVRQPGSNSYWLRCPVGQQWTGKACKGNAKRMNWNKALKACPKGYRLPTRQEFMSLLGGCDDEVRIGKCGYCNSCAKSGKCRSMFGKDEKWYWSSSPGCSLSAWAAPFVNGDIHDSAKNNDLPMRCLRVGT